MKDLNQAVERAYKSFPLPIQKKMGVIRLIIRKEALRNPEIGGIEETLKWSEPSYLPKNSRVGTTLRINWKASTPNQYGVYFHCQTKLAVTFKKKYPGVFKFEGTRGIIFSVNDPIPKKELSDCVALALTYHL